MVNLRLLNYVLSKYVLLSFFCVAQCAMLLGIVFFDLGFNGGVLAFIVELVQSRRAAAMKRYGARLWSSRRSSRRPRRLWR